MVPAQNSHPATTRRAGSLHEIPGLHTALGLMHLPAHDLAAVQVDDQVQEIELTANRPGQPGDVPAPHRVGLVSSVCRWGPALSLCAAVRVPVLAPSCVHHDPRRPAAGRAHRPSPLRLRAGQARKACLLVPVVEGRGGNAFLSDHIFDRPLVRRRQLGQYRLLAFLRILHGLLLFAPSGFVEATGSLTEGADNSRKILFGLIKTPIDRDIQEQLKSKAKSHKIIFIAITFADIVRSLRSVCKPYEIALRDILADYEEYLTEEGRVYCKLVMS